MPRAQEWSTAKENAWQHDEEAGPYLGRQLMLPCINMFIAGLVDGYENSILPCARTARVEQNTASHNAQDGGRPRASLKMLHQMPASEPEARGSTAPPLNSRLQQHKRVTDIEPKLPRVVFERTCFLA